MAEKILYLLGAGASAKALPLAKTIPNQNVSLGAAMQQFAHNIKNGVDTPIKSVAQKEFFDKIADDLVELAKESQKFTTVDTYAKFLYIKDKAKYERVKYLLSIYFSIEQAHYKKLDPRYLVWLTSLLEREHFPENIKIVSWNYDFQVQLSAEIFRKENLNYAHTVTVHSPPLISYFPNIGNAGIVTDSEVSLLHLNGIAGFFKSGQLDFHVFLDHALNKNDKYIDNLKNANGYSNLYFAWERFRQQRSINILKKMLNDVTIMVVIGYSFPFFNRNMDMEVYNVLRDYASLKKIYFQDPYGDGTFLRTQFGYPNEVEIYHVKETDAFYIPFEL